MLRAFSRIEPLGESRADLRSALLVQAVLAPHVRKPRPLEDYVLDFWALEQDTRGGSDGS